ncbi:MAG: PBP1A family penicillin-binding protein [Hyphomicrobiaceae bacterium]|nr:PBP1A family penicillin-binding protein [Hyphomicrobiaceae bacterium]
MAGSQPDGVGADANGKTGAASSKARRSWLQTTGIIAGYSLVALSIGVSIQLIRYTIRFPDPRALSINEAGPTVRVLARDGSVMAQRGERNDFVPLDRLPRHLVNAVIAIEDRRFFEHWGLDPSGLVRAFFANLRAGRNVQGGSTLTQQLAKNLFLTTDKTLNRKLEELVLAVWLELRLSKKEILELYLNRVYFGGGSYGVEAAARRFFDKPARAVTVAEAAVIAGLLKAPSKYSPFANPGHARARARVVVRAMRAAGLLSPVAEAAAIRHSVRFADPEAGRRPTGLEYAVDYVLDRLPPIASFGRKEILVETTIDAGLQKRAQATVEAMLAREGQAAGAGQAALVVLDTSGGIRALVGGRSFAESQFDRAVKARRQPGSAFKPLVYLAAVEQGMGADTVIADAPIDLGGWSPRNEDGRYRGPVTLRSALAHSINTVAVRLQQEVGGEKVAAVARRLGIATKLRPDASMALGTSEVGLLELTGAYGVLAAGGAGIEPHAITRVRIGDGPAVYERDKSLPRMVVSPDTVGVMNTMLNAVIVSGTGRRAALPRHQAAGKTGTTQEFRDAWFVGYTAHLVGGVWFGNDDGTPMTRVAGGGLPAETWRTIMAAAHEGLAPRPLPAIDPMREEPAGSGAPAVATMPRVPLARSGPASGGGAGRAEPTQRAAAAIVPGSKAEGAPAMPPKAAAQTPKRKRPSLPAARRPAEPIDPAFLARMLAEEPAQPGPPPALAGAGRWAAGQPLPGAPALPAAGPADDGAGPHAGFNSKRIREALGGGAAGPTPRMGLGAGH